MAAFKARLLRLFLIFIESFSFYYKPAVGHIHAFVTTTTTTTTTTTLLLRHSLQLTIMFLHALKPEYRLSFISTRKPTLEVSSFSKCSSF